MISSEYQGMDRANTERIKSNTTYEKTPGEEMIPLKAGNAEK